MGETLGRFELLAQIAAGGMAEIHMARQRGMEGFEKLVVIKRLLPDLAAKQQVVQLFLNEARIAARLTHPNVIQIYDLGKEARSYFIAMEYIQGENLRIVLKSCAERDRILPLQHSLEIVRQVCEGLHYAHTKTDTAGEPLNIVHCDISPQNILVSFDGVAKVVDFGIARAAATLEETDPGRVRGKHGYMSPEQCRGKPLDARSDLFSLGIVLWELCTSRRLFKRSTPLETLKAIVGGAVVSPRKYNPKMSVELEGLIMRALDTDPSRRFQTGLQMGMALDKELKGLAEESGSMQLGVFLRRLFSGKLERFKKIEEATAKGEVLDQGWFMDDGSGSDQAADSLPPPVTIPPPLDDSEPSADQLQVGAPQAGRRRMIRLGLLSGVALVLAVVLGIILLPRIKGWLAPPSPVEKVLAPARIEVHTTPAGAEVLLDGKRICVTPCEVPGLEPGRSYALKAEKAGYLPYTDSVNLSPGEAIRRFELQLRRKPGVSYGWVEIQTDPSGARVELNGKLLPRITPLASRRVLAGRKHTLRAWVDDNRVWMTTFRVRHGEKKVLKGVLPK